MKILVLSHMYPNKINPVYGIYVHEQVRALKALGCEVKVISPVSLAPFPLTVLSEKWKRYAQVPGQAIMDGIEIAYPRVPNLPGGRLLDRIGKLWYRRLRRLVARIQREFPFEIIHSHVALPDGQAGVLLGREFAVPVLTFIHGADFQVTIHRGEKLRRAVAAVLKDSAGVVTVSRKLERIGRELSPARYEVIPNGVSLDKVWAGGGKPAKAAPMLLAVGNLKKTKGFDLVITALSRLGQRHPRARLLIIGSGAEAGNLRAQAQELGVSDKVQFLGQMEHGKVMEYMAQADVFVLPSWQEGFGVVYVEAMAHGVPVIACQGQGIADIIRDGENGILVPPRDSGALEAALDRLLTEDDLRLSMGCRGRELVVQGLTWQHNAERVMALGRELME